MISLDELRSIRKTTEKSGKADAVIISKDELARIKDATTVKTKEDVIAEKKAREERYNLNLWLCFCYFHNGDYRKAVDVYDEILKAKDARELRRDSFCSRGFDCGRKQAITAGLNKKGFQAARREGWRIAVAFWDKVNR